MLTIHSAHVKRKILKRTSSGMSKNSESRNKALIQSYWKRLSCAYIDLVGQRIDNGTELEIRDVYAITVSP
jgi:hypothetical protein